MLLLILTNVLIALIRNVLFTVILFILKHKGPLISRILFIKSQFLDVCLHYVSFRRFHKLGARNDHHERQQKRSWMTLIEEYSSLALLWSSHKRIWRKCDKLEKWRENNLLGIWMQLCLALKTCHIFQFQLHPDIAADCTHDRFLHFQILLCTKSNSALDAERMQVVVVLSDA